MMNKTNPYQFALKIFPISFIKISVGLFVFIVLSVLSFTDFLSLPSDSRISEVSAATPVYIEGANNGGSLYNFISMVMPSDQIPVFTTKTGVYRCNDVNCSAVTLGYTFVATSGSGASIQATIALSNDGYPIVAWDDTTSTNTIRVRKCSTLSCSSGTTTTIVSGRWPGIAVDTSTGYPIISYNTTSATTAVYKCSNASCTSGSSNVIYSTGASGASSKTVMASDNLPLVVFQEDGASGGLRYVKCGNAACSSGNTTALFRGWSCSSLNIKVARKSDGNPVISYQNGCSSGTYSLYVMSIVCTNSACSSSNEKVLDSSAQNYGYNVSVAIDTNQYPRYAFGKANAGVRVVSCSDTTCSSFSTQTAYSATNSPSNTGIIVNSSNIPIIIYETTNLYIMKCDVSNCSLNTPPTQVSGPIVSYLNARTRTGVNTTWSFSFRYDDAEQTGANALSWQLRTASGGGGTLITSGTATSGQTYTSGQLPYNQTGIVEGTSNTVYIRVYDGTEYGAEWMTWVYRDTVNPTSSTSISHSPANVSTDNNYTVTFTPNDAASTNNNELLGYVYTGANGTGTYLTGTSATSGQSKTTSTITDTALTQGNNTRYLRVCDGANNCSDTSFTVIKNSLASISSPTKNSITVYGANLGGNVTSDNGNTVTGRGVCVGTSADPALGGNCLSTSGTTGIFSVLFSNLTGATVYHYRAYATNSAGTIYTTDDTFTTITPATGCTFPVSGDVSISSTCNIPTDGLTVNTTQLKLVGSDTGSIQMNADMTINPGSILVWGPGKQIIRAPGVTMFNATGTQITQKYICLYDPDSDGVPNDYVINSQGGTAVLQDSSNCGANYIRPSSLNSTFLNFNSAIKDLAPNDSACFDSATCI